MMGPSSVRRKKFDVRRVTRTVGATVLLVVAAYGQATPVEAATKLPLAVVDVRALVSCSNGGASYTQTPSKLEIEASGKLNKKLSFGFPPDTRRVKVAQGGLDYSARFVVFIPAGTKEVTVRNRVTCSGLGASGSDWKSFTLGRGRDVVSRNFCNQGGLTAPCSPKIQAFLTDCVIGTVVGPIITVLDLAFGTVTTRDKISTALDTAVGNALKENTVLGLVYTCGRAAADAARSIEPVPTPSPRPVDTLPPAIQQPFVPVTTIGAAATSVPPSMPASPLAYSLSENPFKCDNGSRIFGQIVGAQPIEYFTFTSPQASGISPGNADGNGVRTLYWQCSPGTNSPAQLNAYGSSGRFITIDFTMSTPVVTPVTPTPATPTPTQASPLSVGLTMTGTSPVGVTGLNIAVICDHESAAFFLQNGQTANLTNFALSPTARPCFFRVDVAGTGNTGLGLISVLVGGSPVTIYRTAYEAANSTGGATSVSAPTALTRPLPIPISTSVKITLTYG